MKENIKRIVWSILSMLVMTSLRSQVPAEMKATEIKPAYLSIAYTKTTNLIFPYSIISVDRGSSNVLVQKAKGVENILQLKAGAAGFDETNLTVITAEGRLYSYILNYADHPSSLNISYEDMKQPSHILLEAPWGLNEKEMAEDVAFVADQSRTIYGAKDKSYGIRLRLQGIYIHKNVMYYHLEIKNNTNIDYDIDQLRFFLRDQKRSKRTAYQEQEIQPIHKLGDTAAVTGSNVHHFVFALPKITIPDQKTLVIQVMEKSGGRHLGLQLGNRTLIKATPIF